MNDHENPWVNDCENPQATVEEFQIGQIVCVPNLFRNKSTGTALVFDDMEQPDCFVHIAQGQLIMSSFTCEEWPTPADSRAVKRTTVFVFPVAVSIVPMPYRAGCRFGLKESVDNLYGVYNPWIICGP